jgi:hypothetical protein
VQQPDRANLNWRIASVPAEVGKGKSRTQEPPSWNIPKIKASWVRTCLAEVPKVPGRKEQGRKRWEVLSKLPSEDGTRIIPSLRLSFIIRQCDYLGISELGPFNCQQRLSKKKKKKRKNRQR